MGIADIRDAFNAVTVPHGIRCTSALMNYCDKYGTDIGLRTHSKITFNCVNEKEGGTSQYTTDLLTPGTSAMMAAAAVANRIVNAQATANRTAEIGDV